MGVAPVDAMAAVAAQPCCEPSPPAPAVIVIPFGDGWFRAIAWDRLREQAPLSEPVTVVEMRDAFQRIAGDDFGMSEMRWSSRFLSEQRQARHYRGHKTVHHAASGGWLHSKNTYPALALIFVGGGRRG